MKILRISSLLLLLSTLVFSGVNIRASNFPAGTAKTTEAANHLPAIIFLIRHAEKPLPEEKSPHLSPEGVRHAELLPSLFIATGSNTPRFTRPDVLFATAASKHSNREVETLTPLSLALHLPIHDGYADEDTDGIAKEILSGKYAGKVVLICWHHGRMPNLARALGATNAPAKIDDNVFDQIWRIQWRGGKLEFSAGSQGLPLTSSTR